MSLASRDYRDEIIWRLHHTPKWFIETFFDLIHRDLKLGIRPFVFTLAQQKYEREIVQAGVKRVIVGKCRKFPGFSTLELAYGLCEVLSTPGCRYGIFAHKQETANNLNRTIRLLYESAWRNLQKAGIDPHYVIPEHTSKNVMGYDFGEINSGVFLGTASGRGVGQSDRYDRVYATEYSDWENAEQARAGLEGSQPLGARFIIDFNAHGTGNDAYNVYTRAKLPHTDPDWNGYTAFFAGVLDCSDLVTPEQLDERRRALGPRFPEVYPSNDEEMFLANDLAVWTLNDLLSAKALGEQLGYQPDARDVIHAVDTASGNPGGDFQVCSSWGRTDEGIWCEIMPPIRGHWPEDVFAQMVAERCFDYPGLCIVERNVGSAVLVTLKNLDVPNLYKHRHRDKAGKQFSQLGFPTTYASKKIMIADVGRMLRDGEIALVPTLGDDGYERPLCFTEMKEYEWKVKDELGQPEQTDLAGAPEKQGAHDDYAMTVMLMSQAIGRATIASTPQFTQR